MILTLDARLYGLKHAGIGRYLLNLIPGLVAAAPDTQFHLLLPPQAVSRFSQANVTPMATTIKHYGLQEQLLLPRLLATTRADLYHFPHFSVPLSFHRPFVVTIHDLLWHEVKNRQATTLSPLVYRLKYFGYRAVVRHVVTQARAIITPSQYVKQQILNFYPATPPAKIHVIYEGVDPHLLRPVSSQPSTINQRIYLLYVGSLYPHKNLSLFIRALNGSIPLIIVSARSVFQDQLRAQVQAWGLAKQVQFTGYLSDQQLASVISRAQALVQPSLSEGFGLTGLEAMALGTPVLAARAGALPEVYGQAALWFDPKVPTDFNRQLNRLPQQRQRLIRLGHHQAQKYSWVQTVVATLKVYDQVA
ncbi:hypothetical protein A2W24_05770 [Microgenomates group bacterium RBG_16_45_19]|nr:MAG: hypothetical protein A2W24_05770 [Microgenomates group bacterium RBG_16_45_19]